MKKLTIDFASVVKEHKSEGGAVSHLILMIPPISFEGTACRVEKTSIYIISFQMVGPCSVLHGVGQTSG